MSRYSNASLRYRFPWKRIITYTMAIVVALYLLAPFTWLVITSLMVEVETLEIPPHWIPQNPTLQNYAVFFDPNFEGFEMQRGSMAYSGGSVQRMRPALRNSLITAVSVAILNVIVGSMAAYSLARLRFQGNRLLLIFYLGSRMLPAVSIIIPMYMILNVVGILDTVLSLIISYTTLTLPFTIWILKSYFQTIPKDLEEAARVDRCNWINMMIHVFLPVAAPGLVAAAIFSFLISWKDFLFALMFTSTNASKTLPVVVAEFVGPGQTPRALMAAGGVLAVIPPLVLALAFQRLIVQGLVAGAVKG